MAPTNSGGRGPSIDRGVEQGGVDPTANVIALVEANAKSSDQLRQADIKFNDAQHAHLKEIGVLRDANAATLRMSDLDRLGKTREVDVTTGAAQAQALATAVQTLAVASDKNAEAIRNQMNTDRAALAKQVTDTAATLSANNDSAMKDVNNRIAELQKSSYQGVGKSSVADPQMDRMAKMVEALVTNQATAGGKREGLSDGAKALIAIVGIVGTLVGITGGLLGIAGVLYAALRP